MSPSVALPSVSTGNVQDHARSAHPRRLPRRGNLDRGPARYILALLALAPAYVAHASMPGLSVARFMFFHAAVLLVSLYLGLGPGLLATFTAAALVNFAFLPSPFAWSWGEPELLATFAFVAIQVTIAFISNALRKARRQARAERDRLSAIFDAAPALIAILRGPDHVIEFVNALSRKVGGERDLVGKPIVEAFPSARAKELLDRVYQSGEPVRTDEVELTAYWQDGGEARARYFTLYLEPLREGAGRVEGVTVFALDVTQQILARRKAEELAEALRTSEASRRRLFEAGIIGVLSWEEDGGEGRITDANDTFLRMIGYTREELAAGKLNWRKMTPPEYTRMDDRALQQIQSCGATEPYEKEYIRKDGRRIPVLLGAVAPEGPQGRGIAFVLDMTEQRRARRRLEFLAAAGAQLSSSLDYEQTLERVARMAVPEFADWAAVDILVEDGSMRRMALAHVDAAGVPLTGENYRQYPLVPGDAVSLSRVMSTGHSVFVEELPAQEPGDAGRDPTLKSLIIAPMKARGRTIGAITFVMAESDRRYSRDDVAFAEALGIRAGIAVDNARLYRDSEEASRLKDEFLSTVSHELRTPLTSIRGWSSLLLRGDLSEQKRQRAIETIDRNARLQGQLIEDLLDVSRIISGKMRLELRWVEPLKVVEEALESVRPTAEAKSVRLQSSLEPTAGPIQVDPSRLQQVVWNLLSNAIKFTPSGGQVQVNLARVGSHVEIVVTDTGQGIPPSFLPRLFERFTQADSSTTRSKGGLGLGLSIVRHLVEMHGGSVEASSEGEGKGARFTVKLPLPAVRPELSKPEQVQPIIPPEVPQSAQPELTGLKILVVDDERDAREMFATILEGAAAEVLIAASAEEALWLLNEHRPDLLLSDIGMPARDGYDLIAAIRKRPPAEGGRIPAVALTAYARREDRARVLAAGYDVHLSKPVVASHLLNVIHSLARKARAESGA